MSLPITSVVDVSILIAPKAKALQSFGKLMFVTDETPLVMGLGNVLSYGGYDEVTAEWAPTSEVAKAANTFYMSGAKDFMVTIAAKTATPALLAGGALAPLADIQAITAGGFSITVNGVVQDITGLDFSGAADMDAVVAILQAEITGATVSVVGGLNLLLTSDVTGMGSNISFATADIAGAGAALGLLSSSGALITEARVPETPVEALIRAEDIDPSFYGVLLHKQWRDSTTAMDAAEHVSAGRRVFFNTSNDVRVLDAASEEDICTKIKEKSLMRVLSHYSSHPEEYPSAAVAGRAFLVNFEGTNTTITLNLKKMPGVTVEKLRTTQANALKDKNCNAVVDIAGMYVYSDSRMGDGTWFDAVHGVDWLQNRIETGIFNRMYTTTTKVPYTDTGVSILIHEIEQALIQGRTNGLLAPGNNLQGEYLPLGYRITYIPTAQVSQADKSNRVYKGITFEAVGAGAMHQVVVGGSFNE